MKAVSVELASSSNRFNFKIIHHSFHAAVKGSAPIIEILGGKMTYLSDSEWRNFRLACSFDAASLNFLLVAKRAVSISLTLRQ